ncbi:T9SS type A sorting domain-containing protein [Neolewinella sp.]|uniref:T9SS type A sorting domain-containing protein n=1 Tax=Neolewinella sp. TaxID=2993543 RepID=UPI003B529471
MSLFKLVKCIYFILICVVMTSPQLGGQECATATVPTDMVYVAGGVQESSIRVSFTPAEMVLSEQSLAVPVSATGLLAGTAACPRRTDDGTWYFGDLEVRRTVDCGTEAAKLGAAGSPVHDAFLTGCRESRDTTAALQLTQPATYESFYFVIYQPGVGGGYFPVAAAGDSTFTANDVNEFGYSKELPPVDSTGGPPSSVKVEGVAYASLEAAVNGISTATYFLADRETVQVYPNPTSGTLWMELEGVEWGGWREVILYDPLGRYVSRWSLDIGEKVSSLELGHLPPGTYTLLVRGITGQAVHRVVKQ